MLEETGVTVKAGNAVYVFDYIEHDDAGKNQISIYSCRFCR